MSDTFFRIITWNANGLCQRVHELESFLHINSIDIALISETHFTHLSYIKINGYTAYWTTHPSGRARGGTAVLIKKNITHYHNWQAENREEDIQTTVIAVWYRGSEFNFAAAYCPPRQTIVKDKFISIFKKLEPRFIIGGDYNVKHTAWGSRLISPGKGKELLSAMGSFSCEYHSSGSPTYWPTDNIKTPELIDFFISIGISSNYVESIEDLSLDHTPNSSLVNT